MTLPDGNITFGKSYVTLLMPDSHLTPPDQIKETILQKCANTDFNEAEIKNL